MTAPPFQTGKTTISVSRTGQGTYTNGRYVDGALTLTNIEANVQPAREKDLLNFPEGQRTRDAIKIYTIFELRSAKEGTDSLLADRITYKGDVWEVQQVESWEMGVLDHIRAIAFKLDTP